MLQQPPTSSETSGALRATSLASSSADRYCFSRDGQDTAGRPARQPNLPRQFPAGKRLIVLTIGAVLVVALAVARYLNPDPAGHGTHRQLGLPPCTFVVLFGKRCPSCGMTTAWAHLTRGEVRQAAAANVGGLVLAAMAGLAAPWLILSALFGKWLVLRPTELRVVLLALAVAAVIIVDWYVKTGRAW